MNRRAFHFQLVMVCYSAFFTGLNVRAGEAWLAVVMAALTVVMVFLADHEARRLEQHALEEARRFALELQTLARQLCDLLKRASS